MLPTAAGANLQCTMHVCAIQLWVEVMSWYAGQRQRIEAEIKKYSDPPSDRLLPDLHPQLR